MKYLPHTSEELAEMLSVAGVKSLDDLYSDVPEAIRFRREYNLPEAMSEIEIRNYFDRLASLNDPLICFAGAGCYDHYAPSIVQSIIQRSEFLTCYTPYQAEISQGTLHYIFEFQSMMAEMTGMDISNASMYDGATATAEAAIMAMAAGKKCTKVLVSSTIDPRVRAVLETYAHFHGFGLETVGETNGQTDRNDLQARLNEGGVAGVIVQQPNYYGVIEDFSGMADICHNAKSLFIINSIIADLAVLKTPGEWGADIAVGDGQSLGIPMNFGGPGVGYMCCTEKLLRKMPGRIVGLTKDNREQRAFVLTLQAREQHIRRQKATSNICSNQSLMALYVTIYLSLMGKQGIKEAAELSYAGAHYLHDELVATGWFKPKFDAPFFNEFCLTYDGDVDALIEECADRGFLVGVKTDDSSILIAVTEQRTKQDIDNLVETIKSIREDAV
ncbi:MAG: aminomethyl-transferring glycine dehydrogenase subunit GcvPA [Bacteroidaceae bacterium]|nr:aminomethyl-transferring glycine dehydrogenase subunit GcvPA [Bacteroidaceae bacterium]